MARPLRVMSGWNKWRDVANFQWGNSLNGGPMKHSIHTPCEFLPGFIQGVHMVHRRNMPKLFFFKFYIIFDVKTVKCTHPPRNEVELQPNLIEFWVCHSSRKAYQIPVIKNVETSEFNACFHQCKTTCLKPEAPERISQECINIQLTFFFEKRCLIICQSALIFSVLGFRSSLVLELSLQTVRAVQVIAA